MFTCNGSSKGLILAALAALAAGGAELSSGVASASPVLLADYKAVNYNASTGVWTDSSGNGNNATVANDPATPANAPTLVANATPNGSSAVGFDGNYQYLGLTTQLSPSNGYTVLAFAEPMTTATSGIGGASAVVGGGPGGMEYRIQTNSNGNNMQVLLHQDVTAFGASNSLVPTSSFSMIGVATDNQGNASFYFDGNPDGTTTGSSPFNANLYLIGGADSGDNGAPTEFFVGNMAELQIYSGILTASQVQTVDESFVSAYVTPVPEPASLGIVALGGLGGLLLIGRKGTNRRIA